MTLTMPKFGQMTETKTWITVLQIQGMDGLNIWMYYIYGCQDKQTDVLYVQMKMTYWDW